MAPTIVVLSDQSGEVSELVSKLKGAGFLVEETQTATATLDLVSSLRPSLLIASGDSRELDSPKLAEKVYDTYSIPTFLVLAAAGDATQNRMIRHPGIIGVFFSPLNVEKLFLRIRKFFEMLDTPLP